MLTIVKVTSSGGTVAYLARDSKEEPALYYDRGQKKIGDKEVVGIFFGPGAEKLRIIGDIFPRDTRFRALLDGLDPNTGEALRQGAQKVRTYHTKDGKEKPCPSPCGFDLTFSADKTVSTLWALSTPEVRRVIEQSHHTAIELALRDWVTSQCTTRTGHGGKNVERAAPIYAAFPHYTSREDDPQLHTHVILLNAVIRECDRGGALDARFLFGLHHQLGQSYRNRLDAELYKNLHLEAVPVPFNKGLSFEIRGVPKELCQQFSKRRKQVEQEVAPNAKPRQVQVAVLKTRKKKEYNLTLEELTEQWREEARPYNFEPQQLLEEARKAFDRKVNLAVMNAQLTEFEQVQANENRPKAVIETGFELYPDVPHKEPAKETIQPDTSVYDKIRDYAERVKSLWYTRSQTNSRIGRTLAAYGKGVTVGAGVLWHLYDSFTGDPYLLRTRLGPEVAYAFGIIAKRQRNYLLSKYGHKPAGYGLPRRKWSIHLAYATRRITKLQQEYLLELYRHERGPYVSRSQEDVQRRSAKKLWSRESERLDAYAQREQLRRRRVAKGELPPPRYRPIDQRPERELDERER